MGFFRPEILSFPKFNLAGEFFLKAYISGLFHIQVQHLDALSDRILKNTAYNIWQCIHKSARHMHIKNNTSGMFSSLADII